MLIGFIAGWVAVDVRPDLRASLVPPSLFDEMARGQIGAGVQVLTPDDLLAGARPDGERIVLYDDDHYYMGGVLAELLAREGRHVTLVTPEPLASAWTVNTMEQMRTQRGLLESGVDVLVSRALVAAGGGRAVSACVFTDREQDHAADAVVLVTARLPRDDLAEGLGALAGTSSDGPAVRVVGDALSPGTIAVRSITSSPWNGVAPGCPNLAGFGRGKHSYG